MTDPRPTREGCDRAAKILILFGWLVVLLATWAYFR